MTLKCCASEDAWPPLQPLFLVEEITHRVINEYAEAIRPARRWVARAAGAGSASLRRKRVRAAV